jgi:type VI secretion system Hcp family effector
MRRSLRILVCLAAVTLAASAAEAQNRRWFLLLEGSGGPISAHSGVVTPGLTDTTEIHSYGQNFFIPIDSMGNPGQLSFRPVRVVKDVDGSSPRIAEALANGETLTTCTLTLYELAGGGGPTPLYEIILTGGRLIGVSGGGESVTANGPGTEIVSILFQSMKITDLASGQSTTIP